MFRKLLIAGVILLVVAVAVKKMHLGSYVCSTWKQGTEWVQKQIPPEVEFNRLEHEIAQIDRDIQGMVKPLAELKFDIQHHEKEVAQIEETVKQGKRNFTTWVNQLEGGSPVIFINDKEYTRDQVSRKLSQGIADCKRLENQLKTKRQILEAKEQRYNAVYEQAENLVAKKQEFEIRLANLRAELERQKAYDIVNQPIHGNDGRVRVIEEGIQRLEQNRAKKQIADDIRNSGPFAQPNEATTEPQPAAPEVDLQEIREYLNGAQAVRQE